MVFIHQLRVEDVLIRLKRRTNSNKRKVADLLLELIEVVDYDADEKI